MQAIIFTDMNGTRFFLTSESFASDIPERAATFRDLSDASLRAARENAEGWLRGQTWRPAYRMSDGAVVPFDGEFADGDEDGPGESMGGDHASALESVYGPND